MKIQVLDHGYIELIESWGSDERIIEAARMSTDKGFQGWGPKHSSQCADRGHLLKALTLCIKDKDCIPGDEKLLAYLYNHKHMTPFEMAGMTLEVQAPIFVFREWQRHRTQSYNELSARYTELPDLFYVPSIERLMGAKQGQKNKQGSEEGFTQGMAEALQGEIINSYKKSRDSYQVLLDNKVSREIARLVIPVAQYSKMRASANLRNWLQFLTLRMADDVQFETQQYANTVGELIATIFPRTWNLFNKAES